MRILLFSRYTRRGASSRVRSYQYLPYLEAQGIRVVRVPLFNDEYLARIYAHQPVQLRSVLSAYCNRVIQLLESLRYDFLWIESELLPWLPPWVELLLNVFDIPYILDYDDSIFHRYDLHQNGLVRSLLGRKIDTIMRRAALVIVGNDYLADRARQAGAKRVEYLPTVVDMDRYKVVSGVMNISDIFTIGWIGSPITAPYLELIGSALREICHEGRSRVVVIGPDQTGLEDIPLEIRPWSEETEVGDIQSFDVGIMPLADGPWERGKCGYKIIQYMACGKPAVASPVGVNRQIIEHGITGFLPATKEQWVCALKMLRGNHALRHSMGKRGRLKVEAHFSLQVAAPRLVALFESVVADSR